MGASVGWRLTFGVRVHDQASRPSHWHDTPGRRDCFGVRRATILSLRSAYSTYNELDLSGLRGGLPDIQADGVTRSRLTPALGI